MKFPRRNKIAKNCDLDKNIGYRQKIDFKPRCYWYSLGDEWYKFWYEGEKMDTVKNQVVCEIKVKRNMFTTLKKKEKGKILVIDSLEEVNKLYKKYSKLVKFGTNNKKYRFFDFNEVAKIYGGIEFRNYSKIKSQIFEETFYSGKKDKESYKYYMYYFSYYTIDVSSGCVWDLDLIDVKKIGKLKDFV